MPVNRKQSPLKPLPMRVTVKQFERLHAARSRDEISVQEHVRRALDLYLAKIEREALASRPSDQGDVQPPAAEITRGQPPGGPKAGANANAAVPSPSGPKVKQGPKVVFR